MNQEKLKIYIRFGVHKEREVLQKDSAYFDGIVVPGHILAYTPEPTVAAISYIRKPFFFDPMTYIYKYNHKQYVIDDEKKRFKPSVYKLTAAYDLIDFFEREDFRPLKESDLTDDFIQKLVHKTQEFQFNKVNNVKETSIKRYEDLLKTLGENYLEEANHFDYKPEFFSLPYFDFKDISDGWFDVNKRIYAYAKSIFSNLLPTPILAFPATALSHWKELIEPFKDAKQIIFWIQGNDEVEENERNLKNYTDFVVYGASLGIKMHNLYGTYFSVMLNKLGLSGLSHGIYYGEKKGIKATLGGIPLPRYYVEQFHEFYPIAKAFTLVTDYPELLCKCDEVCAEFVGNDIGKIYEFSTNQALAQRHFLSCRSSEVKEVANLSLKEVNDSMEEIYKAYKEKFRLKSPDFEIVNIEHLSRWVNVLKEFETITN